MDGLRGAAEDHLLLNEKDLLLNCQVLPFFEAGNHGRPFMEMIILLDLIYGCLKILGINEWLVDGFRFTIGCNEILDETFTATLLGQLILEILPESVDAFDDCL